MHAQCMCVHAYLRKGEEEEEKKSNSELMELFYKGEEVWMKTNLLVSPNNW